MLDTSTGVGYSMVKDLQVPVELFRCEKQSLGRYEIREVRCHGHDRISISRVQSKLRYEQFCRNHGIVPQEFHTDRGSAFFSEEFHRHLQVSHQGITYASTGAHYHNGVTERAIQTITSCTRTMMLHAPIYWPEAADTQFWPLAVHHAVPICLTTCQAMKWRESQRSFYQNKASNKRFSDLLSTSELSMTQDPTMDTKVQSIWLFWLQLPTRYRSSVALLLNPRTGYIVSNYHVVFDDWTISVDDC